jgi:glutathione S-transferase
MYTLYFSPGTASLLIHLALLEIGAAHQLEPVNFDADAQHAPEYLRLNPSGQVPTLIIDGIAVSESAAILMSLSDRHPQAALGPPIGSKERDAWYQWIVYLSNNLQATFRFWFYPGDLGRSEHDPTTYEAMRLRIEKVWAMINGHLERHGPYLLGKKFSAPDLQLTMLMRWSRNMPHPATEWPALKLLADRVCSRPSWQRMREIEKLDDWQ